ncbi:MAG: helix-turn-helix domain-containing protein [Ignavibacteriae bacterium]|nr:helix-turn-helix domain-containing protein [Ignavibacteriota bacterium]
MNIILIIGIFESLVLALLLFLKKNRTISNNLLASFFVIYGINILTAYIEIINQKQGYPYPALIMLTPAFLLLHGPLLWLYIKSLQGSRNIIRKYLFHFLPFVLFIFNLSIRFWFIPDEEKIGLMTSESFQLRWTYFLFVLVIAVSIPTYLFFGLVELNRIQKRVKEFYSTMDNNNLNWLRNLVFVGLILYSIFGFLHISNLFFSFISYKDYQEVAFVIASVFILILGFLGHKQTTFFNSENDFKIINSTNLEINSKVLYDKLEFLMKRSKPYLNPDLTILDLANLMEIDTSELSKYLNKTMELNFYTYINKYRIQTFKEYVESNKFPDYNILGIAFECGFNSKATFNRVFKYFENTTPKAYIQSLKKNKT